jgi:hypothetical protein
VSPSQAGGRSGRPPADSLPLAPFCALLGLSLVTASPCDRVAAMAVISRHVVIVKRSTSTPHRAAQRTARSGNGTVPPISTSRPPALTGHSEIVRQDYAGSVAGGLVRE